MSWTPSARRTPILGRRSSIVSPSPRARVHSNHFEIHLSQNQIDIYGTDAGTTTPLKHLVNIANANLTITRGLIWIVDNHYNGNKDGTEPNPPTIARGVHTFTWDNVGFDGPVLPRDLAFDVMDRLTPASAGAVEDNGCPSVNLGWSIVSPASQTLTVNGVTGIERRSHPGRRRRGAVRKLSRRSPPELQESARSAATISMMGPGEPGH
jgi:hypothetical protein